MGSYQRRLPSTGKGRVGLQDHSGHSENNRPGLAGSAFGKRTTTNESHGWDPWLGVHQCLMQGSTPSGKVIERPGESILTLLNWILALLMLRKMGTGSSCIPSGES